MLLDQEPPLWRPPSEGENLIVQPTIGCSYNQCTFCGMYRGKTFRIKPLEEALQEIDRAAREWPEASRVFLADGDALVLPTPHLLAILQHLARRLPALTRVSCYALPANLLKKSPEELAGLRAHKLTLLYYGIETGHPPLLRQITKGASAAGIRAGLHKAAAAGIKVSATVILGLGGQALWQQHVDDTVALLHQAPLHYLSTLQLHLEPALADHFRAAFDPPFQPQDDWAILAEQYRLIDTLTHPPRPILFRSNHASNALPLAGTLPRDRPRLLAELQEAMDGWRPLRPQWLRGL